MSTWPSASSPANSLPRTTFSSTSMPGWRRVNASSSGSAASSAKLAVTATRSVDCTLPALRTASARVVGEREDLRGGDRQAPAAGRQLERAAAAHVEVVAELAAQCSDRARNGRLGDGELLRRRLDGA